MNPQTPIQTPTPPRKLFPFMGLRWYFLGLSGLFFTVSLFFILNHGFNFGVDFKGGVKLVYKFQHPIGDEDIRSALRNLVEEEAQIVGFGNPSENSYMIKIRFHEDRNIVPEITAKFDEKLGAGGAVLLSEETVGPKVGAELRQRGLFAVGLTLLLILVYIGIRFDFLFAPGAILALIHDTAIALGFFTFFHKEFNLPILAAVLTLIGYSNNDTIIIYDRIRENLRKLPSSVPLAQLIDISLNETLRRTIVTHLTVLFSMLVLFFLGGGVIHDFAFFMVVGVIVGSYSSIFIASPIYLFLHRFFPNKGIVRSTKR